MNKSLSWGRSVTACEGVDSDQTPIVTSYLIAEELMKRSQIKEATISIRRLR
jgi:hypothetical protein